MIVGGRRAVQSQCVRGHGSKEKDFHLLFTPVALFLYWLVERGHTPGVNRAGALLRLGFTYAAHLRELQQAARESRMNQQAQLGEFGPGSHAD